MKVSDWQTVCRVAYNERQVMQLSAVSSRTISGYGHFFQDECATVYWYVIYIYTSKYTGKFLNYLRKYI